MLQFQDIGEVCAGSIRELSTADGAMDGHICLRRIQVKGVDGVGVRLLPIQQQDVVL